MVGETVQGIVKYVFPESLLKFVSINFFIYEKFKKIAVYRVKVFKLLNGNIEWAKQRFKCNDCGQLFTSKNKSVSDSSKEIWF